MPKKNWLYDYHSLDHLSHCFIFCGWCNLYHKLSGLKQHRVLSYNPQVRSPKELYWAMTKMSAELYPSFLEALEKNLLPWLSQLLESDCIPCLMTLTSIFKTSSMASSNLSLTPSPVFFIHSKVPLWLTMGPTRIIQNNFPMLKSAD